MQVLKAFDYSHDGFTAKHLNPGDDPSDVPAECIAGLVAEGYLSDESAKPGAKAKQTKVAEPVETGEPVAIEGAADGAGEGEAAEA